LDMEQKQTLLPLRSSRVIAGVAAIIKQFRHAHLDGRQGIEIPHISTPSWLHMCFHQGVR